MPLVSNSIFTSVDMFAERWGVVCGTLESSASPCYIEFSLPLDVAIFSFGKWSVCLLICRLSPVAVCDRVDDRGESVDSRLHMTSQWEDRERSEAVVGTIILRYRISPSSKGSLFPRIPWERLITERGQLCCSVLLACVQGFNSPLHPEVFVRYFFLVSAITSYGANRVNGPYYPSYE